MQIFVEGECLSCVFLQVCDSILNIGPCANASMGEPAFLSEEVQAFKTLPRVSVDLVTALYFSHCVLRLLTFSSFLFLLTHSSRATLSLIWRSWCVLASARMAHCQYSR